MSDAPRIDAIETLISSIAIMTDVKANNTAGGTSTTSYSARTLNTLADPGGIVKNPASFTGVGGSNSQFQLAAGTYWIKAQAPFGVGSSLVQASRIRLFNVTDAATTVLGMSHQLNTSATNVERGVSHLTGIFTIASQKTFELQHRTSQVVTTDGFGSLCNFSENETYTSVELIRLS